MWSVNRRTLVVSLAALATASMSGVGRIAWAARRTKLKFSEVWIKGLEFSEKTKSLNHKPVEILGFMAPPLKPGASFFVLTRVPMAVCPFCESEADWPDDIVYVKLAEPQEFVQYNVPIKTIGILEIGTNVDEETGFVSELRIIKARFVEMTG